MNQEFIIICVGDHLSAIHDQVRLKTSIALVLIKLWYLEFSRDPYIRNEAHLACVLAKKIFPFESIQFLAKSLNLTLYYVLGSV